MYLLQECRRNLQHGDQMLVDAPDVQRDHVRAVDILAFSTVETSSAAQPASRNVVHSSGIPSSSNTQSSAAQPVICDQKAE